VSDQQTVSELRRAVDAAVRDRHLDPSAAATAWSAAHPPRSRTKLTLAVTGSVLATAATATALTVWGTGRDPSTPPGGGSACTGNVVTAPLPSWARTGFSPAGYRTPHVIGRHGRILAVLFVTLRVHQPPDVGNKVLWVSNTGYGPLHIRATLEGTTRTVTRTLPDGPGPSYVDMPAAGCWRMTLTWAGHSDALALEYAP